MKCIWCDEEITGDKDRFSELGYMHPECTEGYNDTLPTYLEDIEIGSQERPEENK